MRWRHGPYPLNFQGWVRRTRLFLLVAAGLLLFVRRADAGTCVPSSASVQYEADDYLYLYLNGNLIVTAPLLMPAIRL